MYTAPQFSVFMVNKPGVLARVLGEFAKAKINITAITMMDSVEHGVMRVVFEKPETARDVLSKLNMPYNETDVLCVDLANKSAPWRWCPRNSPKDTSTSRTPTARLGARGAGPRAFSRSPT